ncbi:MAG: TerB family tellurite resistance protein [Alphaproteobacteria bacterium]|nr:TerB family tellurite resistance protein [Alphaproteobacteria bacterium]
MKGCHMSDFVMERDMNYAKDLSVEDKKVFLQTLMQLAKTDGSVDGGEKKFIVELARLFGVSSQDAEEIKRKRDDDEVVEAAKVITDRHVAMELVKEMCMLANSDGDLTDREMLLIGRVGLAMGLELEKIEQISRWVVDRIVWIEEGKIIFEKV